MCIYIAIIATSMAFFLEAFVTCVTPHLDKLGRIVAGRYRFVGKFSLGTQKIWHHRPDFDFGERAVPSTIPPTFSFPVKPVKTTTTATVLLVTDSRQPELQYFQVRGTQLAGNCPSNQAQCQPDDCGSR